MKKKHLNNPDEQNEPNAAETEPAEQISPTVPQHPKRLKKSAKVDEQLFQEGLSIALDNEKRQDKGKSKKKSAPKVEMDSRTAQASSTIEHEFLSMIDDMLPSSKKERVACLKSTDKMPKNKPKGDKKQKPAGKKGKKSDKKKAHK